MEALKVYFKSLFPWRWVIVFMMIFCVEAILIPWGFPFYYSLINVVFWFIQDWGIGLGRREDKTYKIFIAVGVNVLIIALLVLKLKTLGMLI